MLKCRSGPSPSLHTTGFSFHHLRPPLSFLYFLYTHPTLFTHVDCLLYHNKRQNYKVVVWCGVWLAERDRPEEYLLLYSIKPFDWVFSFFVIMVMHTVPWHSICMPLYWEFSFRLKQVSTLDDQNLVRMGARKKDNWEKPFVNSSVKAQKRERKIWGQRHKSQDRQSYFRRTEDDKSSKKVKRQLQGRHPRARFQHRHSGRGR